MAGAAAAGDPIAVVPLLFHLLWCHELGFELSTPLHQATLVSASVGSFHPGIAGAFCVVDILIGLPLDLVR